MLKHSKNHLRHGYIQLSQSVTNRAKQLFLQWNFTFISHAVQAEYCLTRDTCIHIANHAKQPKSAGHFHKRIQENATKKKKFTSLRNAKTERITMQASISSPTIILEKGHWN